jgi:hypothetical protein
MTTYRQAGKSQWIPGPFTVMTVGQTCATCSAQIPPGSTGYRCADGCVRCEEHRAARPADDGLLLNGQTPAQSYAEEKSDAIDLYGPPGG